MISREIFVNEAIYQQEQERIFARVWLFVGHESQVPKPGDYFQSCMGEESVILTRDSQHKLHVFLNTCRHRGMKVCRYDEGNTSVFTCPYHGWGYATDGRLVGVPYYKEAYTSAWIGRNGGSLRWRNWRTTRARSGPPGTQRHRRFWTTSAAWHSISTNS